MCVCSLSFYGLLTTTSGIRLTACPGSGFPCPGNEYINTLTQTVRQTGKGAEVDTPDNVLCRVLDVRHQNTHADRLRFPATPPSVGIVAPGGMQQVAQLSSTQTGPKSTNYHTLPVVCRPPSSGPSIIWKFSSFSTPNGKASPIWPHYVRSLHTHTHAKAEGQVGRQC